VPPGRGVRGLVGLGEQDDDVGEDAMIAARNVVGRRPQPPDHR
jgi:hypothetical protein